MTVAWNRRFRMNIVPSRDLNCLPPLIAIPRRPKGRYVAAVLPGKSRNNIPIMLAMPRISASRGLVPTPITRISVPRRDNHAARFRWENAIRRKRKRTRNAVVPAMLRHKGPSGVAIRPNPVIAWNTAKEVVTRDLVVPVCIVWMKRGRQGIGATRTGKPSLAMMGKGFLSVTAAAAGAPGINRLWWQLFRRRVAKWPII